MTHYSKPCQHPILPVLSQHVTTFWIITATHYAGHHTGLVDPRWTHWQFCSLLYHYVLARPGTDFVVIVNFVAECCHIWIEYSVELSPLTANLHVQTLELLL